MTDLLVALLIVVPVVGSALPLAASLWRPTTGWSIAAIVLVIEAGLAGWLSWLIYTGSPGRLVHSLGGPELARPPDLGYAIGIELVADPLSTLVVGLVSGIALATLVYTRSAGPRGNSFYSGYLLLTGGLMGVALTGDLFNLFVFLEITGLATYGLVAAGRSPAAAVAALKYLLIGTVGASLYLLGVGYLYARTGTLNMVDLSVILAGEAEWGAGTWLASAGALYGEPLVIVAFAFIVTGLGVKAALFPLHIWQPDAYQHAPDGVTVYISALVSTAAAYALLRVLFVVFTPAFFATTPLLIEAMIAFAGAGIVVGSLLAVLQARVKRVFAYSSVAHFGLILLAAGVAVHPAAGEQATRFAIYGAVVHLVAHAIMKAGLFAAVGHLIQVADARTVDSYAGLARRSPIAAGAIAVLGFGLVGVPPVVGFVGKWYIALGAIAAGLWPVILVVLASTLLSLLYVARLLERLYFTTPSQSATTEVMADGGTTDRQLGPVAVAGGAALLAVLLGLLGAELTTLIEPLVEAVLTGSPEVTFDG